MHLKYVPFSGRAQEHPLPTGEVIKGSIRAAKMKLIQAWVEIHQDELMADRRLAVSGEKVFRIEPLK